MKRDMNHQCFLNDWSKKKIGKNRSFDDIFRLDDVPLWWFYRKFFFLHVMPKQINTFDEIELREGLSNLKKIKLKVFSHLLKKFLFYSEKQKMNKLRNTFRNGERDKIGEKVMSKNKVLLLSYANHLSVKGEVFRLNEVIKELERAEELEPFLLFADSLSRRDYQKISGFANVYRYYDDGIAKKAKDIAKKLNGKWERLSENIKSKMLCLEKESLWPKLKYSLDFFFSKEFIFLTSVYYEIFKKILREEEIKAVVITGAYSIFEKCLIAAAKQTNVLLIRLDHGFTHLSDNRNPDLIGNYFEATVSEYTKKQLIKMGSKKEKIRVVGSVVYDGTYPFIRKNKTRKLKEKKILLVTSPLVECAKISEKKYYYLVLKIIKEILSMGEVKIGIKPHPIEKKYHIYEKIIRNNKLRNVEVYSPNISRGKFYQLIAESDVFVNFGTDATKEAMIINRPIMTIELIPEKHTQELKEISCYVIYDKINKGMIRRKIEFLLNKDDFFERRINKVRNELGKIDGLASKRVVNLISENLKGVCL